MRILFEGLPGAGKTTLATRLAADLGCPLLGEWLALPEKEWRRHPWQRPFWQVHDELKSQLAGLAAGPVVLDRHYPGALAYAFAQGPAEHQEAMRWYREGLVRPVETVVLLDIPPLLSLARQPRAGSLAPYATEAGLTAIRSFYLRFFGEYEPGARVLTLDATRPLDDVWTRLRDAL